VRARASNCGGITDSLLTCENRSVSARLPSRRVTAIVGAVVGGVSGFVVEWSRDYESFLGRGADAFVVAIEGAIVGAAVFVVGVAMVRLFTRSG
jgi:hypothetical protein